MRTSCRRPTLVLGLGALAALLLAAAVAASPALAASPKPGGTLVIGRLFDPSTYDPHRTTAITVGAVSSLLYDTLLYIDHDLRTLTPGLARSWKVSPDARTYTFQLRDDVRFHSGRKLTAADVKFTFERILDPKTASPQKFRLGAVDAIETPDPTTLVLRLTAPQSDLLLQLANPFMGILDRESVEKHGAKYGSAGMSGTGPFMFKEWILNDHTTLKRFPEYRWGPPFFQNRGPAHVDEIVFRVIPEWQTLLFELERGNVHVFLGARPSDLEVLRRNRQIALLEARPNQQLHYVGFKVTRPGVSDVLVRKAISAAIDKERLVREIQRGLGSAARGMFLPGAPDYWAGQEAIFPRFDRVQARSLLDGAGWKPGPDGIRTKEGQRLKLTLYGMLGTVEGHEELFPLIQAQLKEVGVELDIRLETVAAYFPGLRKQDYDMWSLATPYVAVVEILNFWFSSGNIPSPNRTMWKDARTDELLGLARAATTDDARLKTLQELQRIVAENHLMLPLWHEAMVVPARVEIKGFRPHGLYAAAYYKLLDLWLDR